MSYKPVNPQVNFPELEKQILEHWYKDGIVDRYLHKNDLSQKKFIFLDGPITANNPMGVHHGWGRTYKDLFQRYHTMKGEAQRYQNGFDCQGLWVEVEVEKELGFKTKKDIEVYGVDKFVNKCKERVMKYSAIQTEQSKRLGYFMDWDNSYFTMSDQNNYAIWNFLKKVHQKGWLYQGPDSVPWCPRCETAISQHEILTEDYKELTHESVYIQFPIVGEKDAYLLVWTTTPWTIPANIAVAVDKKLEYTKISYQNKFYYVSKNSLDRVFTDKDYQIQENFVGQKLVGKKYVGPYDHLPAVQKVSSHPLFHTVVPTDPRILPISDTEGTGLVHTAVSAGIEDFQLGKKLGLPMIPIIADNAEYLPELGDLSGQNAKKHPEIILNYLNVHNFYLKTLNYKHRYPACWRCKTELVWKVTDEWYISMDKPDQQDPQKRTYRQQMISVAKSIKWLPGFGKDRELDWLKNMHDWMISKKNRYWGLALPIYNCSCGHFQVIGGKDELETQAVSGWNEFNGHSPHKPWIDAVKIKCEKCGQLISRIPDVGNPWLDAGIVSFSTLPKEWFPADFITESFPGQFKNWFYSLIAMSTVLAKSKSFKTVLGFASLLGEDGRPMHKSWGNAIEFNEGADKIGVDVMRFMYVSQNPSENILFGFKKADETRRRFHLILWNIYNFFVSYANIDNFEPKFKIKNLSVRQTGLKLKILDQWLLIRLQETINIVTTALDTYDPSPSAIAIDGFVSDFSTWYIRRSRDRVGPSSIDLADKSCTLHVINHALITLSQLLAPITPFLSDEIYTNLTGEESVHLAAWPKTKKFSDSDIKIIKNMSIVRSIVELGLSQRKSLGIKVRQPLNSVIINSPEKLSVDFEKLILDELNIKRTIWQNNAELSVILDTKLTPDLIEEGRVRELIRQIQELRKLQNARLDQMIRLKCPLPENPQLQSLIKSHTLSESLENSDTVQITLIP